MARPLKFDTVEEAERVLKPYGTRHKLEAARELGFDVEGSTHKALATFVGASREKVSRAMVEMGLRRRTKAVS